MTQTLSHGERRHGMDEFTEAVRQFGQALNTIGTFTAALNDLSGEVSAFKTDLAVLKEKQSSTAAQADEAAKALNGNNGTKGLKARMERTELYVGIIIGVFVTGGGGALAFIVAQTIKNAYTLP